MFTVKKYVISYRFSQKTENRINQPTKVFINLLRRNAIPTETTQLSQIHPLWSVVIF